MDMVFGMLDIGFLEVETERGAAWVRLSSISAVEVSMNAEGEVVGTLLILAGGTCIDVKGEVQDVARRVLDAHLQLAKRKQAWQMMAQEAQNAPKAQEDGNPGT